MVHVSPIFRPVIKSLKNFLRFFGVDLVGYNLYHSNDVLLQTIISHFHISTILDVGANSGQYVEEVIRHGYNGRILSFEPIPSVFEQLSKMSRKYRNVRAYNIGMGNSETELMINVSENLASSSILNVGDASLAAEPKTRTTHQEKIRITTIDTFLKHNEPLDKEILLKLDVQGYELEALKGAILSLKQIKLIQTELSFTMLYEKGPLYDEIVSFLADHGFEIFTIIPGFRDERSGRMLQADGIFVRK